MNKKSHLYYSFQCKVDTWNEMSSLPSKGEPISCFWLKTIMALLTKSERNILFYCQSRPSKFIFWITSTPLGFKFCLCWCVSILLTTCKMASHTLQFVLNLCTLLFIHCQHLYLSCNYIEVLMEYTCQMVQTEIQDNTSHGKTN